MYQKVHGKAPAKYPKDGLDIDLAFKALERLNEQGKTKDPVREP